MSFFFFRRTIRHPFFPGLAAEPAADARGRAQALAGTFDELARAAARGAEARRAVYALTTEDAPLSDGERDELWRLFQVPVYALLMERGGRVAGWECEAQNGLHIAQGEGESACACGRPGARLTLAERLAHAGD
jgi:hypothetical protein